jgi:hypothetical protein
MPIVTVTEGAGTAEGYESMDRALEQEGAPKPLGQIAGPVEGGFRVINVWASQADVDAVVQAVNRLMQSSGIAAPATSGTPITRTVNPVHRLVINAAPTSV